MSCKNLVIEIAKKNIERNTIAQVLGIHRNSLNNKLSGATQFTVDEAFMIKKVFFPEFDLTYLFSNEQVS